MQRRAFDGSQGKIHGSWGVRWSFWMAALILGACCLPVLVQAANKLTDFKGYQDPVMFTRLPNYYLSISSSFVERQFDAHDFTVSQAGKPVKQRIEGHFMKYYYYFDNAAGAPPSALQVIRNYQNAAARIGAEILYESVSSGNAVRTSLRLVKDGRETWAEIESGNGSTYYVYIVERQAMQQQVTASAEALRAGLTQNGHADVPGIFFDFGKADVKPESGPALQEVAKLLKADPGVRVWVVGHTDYVGAAEANAALAGARAAAVVKALVQDHGLDVKRLSPYGVGPYAPVASNAAEEGRAKNRRVELVVRP